MRGAALLAVVLTLSACAGPAGPCNIEDADPLPPASDECGAAPLAHYAGAEATEHVRAAIADVAGQRSVRYIGPGDAVTQDFRPDRLNVELDDQGRIVRLRCG